MQQIPWPTCLHCPDENVAASQHPKTELPCIHQISDLVTRDTRKSYEEEDTCMSYESARALVTRDTRKSYEEEDTCIPASQHRIAMYTPDL
jgi:hypothetical protein